jgi:biopolymer transport protein ExbB
MATHTRLFKLKLPRRLLLVGLSLLALASTASASSSWWNGEWTLRKKIVLDTGATGAGLTEAVEGAPVLIRLFDANFRFANAQPDGSDLRFVADDGKTLLPYHIEKYDGLLNEAFVWVKVPELKPGAQTVIWLYYGNATGKAGKVEDAKGTYDDNTVLVYHFAEHGQPAYDSSGQGNNAQAAGVPSDGAMIGTGLRLDGQGGVTIPASASLATADAGTLTWSAWIKYTTPQPKAVLYSRRDTGRALVVGVDNGVPYVEITDAAGTGRTPGGAPLAANSWRHLAVIAGNGSINLLLDGETYATMNGSLPGLNGPAQLGGDAFGSNGFSGEMDELEISKVARPVSAIKLAAISQGKEGTAKFLTIGEDEQQTSWLSVFKGGYVGVIVGSLDAPGWVVICILFIMSIISWVVMVRKAAYLGQIGKGNVTFLNEWSHVATDLSALENTESDEAKNMGGRLGGAEHRAMMNTPLYRIYHLGIVEVQHRLAADQGDKILSARSMQAIRATLDGGLVRETQRLNSNMVLLTIAISGGPFLGLLGTVVGVMITFAAVAAAGEVNVNAIAPGIAAALLATVAGLAVAIPSLFGYNYLLTKIKVVTTDMHVFIDEFVTKLAEFYSDPIE